MSQKASTPTRRAPISAKAPAEQVVRVVRDIRHPPRDAQTSFGRGQGDKGQGPHRAGGPEGLRGEDSIADLCRREGIAESLYYAWSKEFLEAGKRRLAGDTARAATTDEVKALRQEARALKEVVAEQALELRLLKKSAIAAGDDLA